MEWKSVILEWMRAKEATMASFTTPTGDDMADNMNRLVALYYGTIRKALPLLFAICAGRVGA